MELKLASGVKVDVVNDEGNKVLRFNEPVRVVALTPIEASKIGVSLNRSKKSTVLPALAEVIESGFLNESKSLPQVRKEVAKLNPDVKGSSLTMALTSMVRTGILKRSGKRGCYAYHRS
jgi:hypothetical protein